MDDSLYETILHEFDTAPRDVNRYSPPALAYIGDAVYDMVVRTYVVGIGPTQTDRMHKKTSTMVCAHAQAQVLKALQPFLTEEEKDIVRRGRNAKSSTMAKNATVGDYRRATGLEALCGYLYMTEQFGRLITLIKKGIREAGLL